MLELLDIEEELGKELVARLIRKSDSFVLAQKGIAALAVADVNLVVTLPQTYCSW